MSGVPGRMVLTGQMDSPFVRRVAIALLHYGMPFERNVISAYDDFGRLLALNPLGKVPALQLPDGTVLVDSTLILDHLDRIAATGSAAGKALLPQETGPRAKLLCHTGVAVGLAEKAVEYRTETVRRPPDKIDDTRVARVRTQIAAALAWLEARTPEHGCVAGDELSHADIASSVALTFISRKNPEHLAAEMKEYREGLPNLISHTARCETLKAFLAAPFGEA